MAAEDQYLLIICDWNNTLGPPKLKQAFFRYRFRDPAVYGEFDDRFHHHLRHGDVAYPDSKTSERIRYMGIEMRQRIALGADAPSAAHLLGLFGVNEMFAFGSVTPTLVYPNALSALSNVRQRAAIELGCRVVGAVTSNTWEPVIRATSLVQSGLISDVEAQSFSCVATGDGLSHVTGPANTVSMHTKPQAIDRIVQRVGVPYASVLFIGNGWSDEPAMRHVKNMGGRVGGTFELDAKGEQDRTQLKALYDEGIVDVLVPRWFSDEIDAADLLFEQVGRLQPTVRTQSRLTGVDVSLARDGL